MSQEQTLEHCPHCGKSHTLKIVLASEHWADEYDGYYPHSERYAVMCDASSPNGPGGCGASGGFKATEADAIAVWNHRAALSATQPAQAAQSGEAEILRDSVAAKADCIDRLGETVERQQSAMRAVMRRLATMLDEDQFAHIENLVTGTGCTPTPPSQPAVAQGAGEVPMGAIVNGRVYIERLEMEGFEDSHGHRMTMCTDWHELRRCFEHLADWAATAPTQPAAGADVLLAIATVRESYRGTDWGKVAECICDAIDAAIAASGRQS